MADSRFELPASAVANILASTDLSPEELAVALEDISEDVMPRHKLFADCLASQLWDIVDERAKPKPKKKKKKGKKNE